MDPDHVNALKGGVASWNAWRTSQPQLRPNLAEAKLRATDLSGANLSRADLSGADLRGAQLIGTDLQGADLRGANLFKAELTGACVSGCDLRGARFLNPDQIRSAEGWQNAQYDRDLDVGASLPGEH
jgi:uncharacterized protein YjbI with pentapeptide repeats